MGTTEGIDGKLRAAWARERAYFHLRGAARLSFWLVGVFLFDLLVDWSFDLPGWGRAVLLLANLLLLGSLAYRFWVRHLARFDPARVALRAERLHPGLNSLLVSYVQFGGTAHGSPGLIAATRAAADRAAAPLSFAGVVSFRTLRRLVAAAGVLLALFAASTAFAGAFYAVLVARMVNPFSDAEYPTRTRIDAVTGDVAVRAGDPVELTALASGEVPSAGTVHVRFDGGAADKLPLDGDGGRFAFRHRQAAEGFEYTFRIGDARSKPHRVTVVAPPRIVSAWVALNPPEYAGGGRDQYPNLQPPPALAGTAVYWEIRLDQPLASAELELLGDGAPKPPPLVVDPGDSTVVRFAVADVADLLPAGDRAGRPRVAAYRFRWTERAHGFTFPDPTRYTLEVRPDLPPVVTLLEPVAVPGRPGLPVTRRKILDLFFEASDDHGLGRAALAFRVNDGPTRQVAVKDYPAGARADRSGARWTVATNLPTLREGDVVACEVEVTDRRAGAANVGRSRSVRMQVVADEEYQAFIRKEQELGLDRTRATLRDELESQGKITNLLPK